MLRLFGERISAQEAANLAVALLHAGDSDSIAAAHSIEGGMPQVADIRLSESERAAIRKLLEAPPPLLEGLRDRLARPTSE